MASLKLYDCDVGFKYNGIDYEFNHVVSIAIEDSERKRLTRGTNATDTRGLAYKEGMRDPKRWTLTIMNLTPEQVQLFEAMYNSEDDRADFYAISRRDGSSAIAKEAILSNRPRQLNFDDSVDTLNVEIEIETFDSSETHKS